MISKIVKNKYSEHDVLNLQAAIQVIEWQEMNSSINGFVLVSYKENRTLWITNHATKYKLSETYHKDTKPDGYLIKVEPRTRIEFELLTSSVRYAVVNLMVGQGLYNAKFELNDEVTSDANKR